MLLQFCFLQVFPSKQLPSAYRDKGHNPSKLGTFPLLARYCASCLIKCWRAPASDPWAVLGKTRFRHPPNAAQMWWWILWRIFFSCPNVHETAEIPRKKFVKKSVQKFVTHFWKIRPLKNGRIHQLFRAPLPLWQTLGLKDRDTNPQTTAENPCLKLQSFWLECVNACQDDFPLLFQWCL